MNRCCRSMPIVSALVCGAVAKSGGTATADNRETRTAAGMRELIARLRDDAHIVNGRNPEHVADRRESLECMNAKLEAARQAARAKLITVRSRGHGERYTAGEMWPELAAQIDAVLPPPAQPLKRGGQPGPAAASEDA